MTNNDWVIEIPFTPETKAHTGGVRITSGVHRATINEVEPMSSGKSYRFSGTISEGTCKGAKVSILVGSDMSKDGNVRRWKDVMLAVGFNDTQTSKPQKASRKTFIGKTALILVVAPPEGTDGFPDVEFVTPDRASKINAGEQSIPSYRGKSGTNGTTTMSHAAMAPRPEEDVAGEILT